MCRLLYVRDNNPFGIQSHLERFAEISKNSKEYQGHGWGCSYLQKDQWVHYRNIKPVWEDDMAQFGKTYLLLAHARSAFRDRDIRVENNMPFHDQGYVFIFNGEIHGVRIREQGRTGAEKIFRFLLRKNDGDMETAIHRTLHLIRQRSRYIRAMNFIIANRADAWLVSNFNEDPDYFTMHQKYTGTGDLTCSEPYPGETDWVLVDNQTIRKLT